ncbi:17271_t:CDS:2, partial [Funneliformis caledonium]
FIAIDERNNEVVSEAQTISQKRQVPHQYSILQSSVSHQCSIGLQSSVSKSMQSISPLSYFKRSSRSNELSSRLSCMEEETGIISMSAFDNRKIVIEHREPHTENLYEFLSLQSFDEIKREGDIEEFEEILTTCIAIAYLEVVLFEKFKDECEMCHEKACKCFKENGWR